LAHAAHINADILKRDFPEWAERCGQAQQEAAQQAHDDMNQRLLQTWQSLIEDGGAIAIIDLASRAAID